MNIQIPDAIKEEWGKLVPAAKYSVIFGLFLILAVWLDDYLKLSFFATFSLDPSQLSLKQYAFGLGILFVLILFPILIFDRLSTNLRIIYYRWRYPLSRLNKAFYIISFSDGRVCVLDDIRKEIRWIKSWQTALDMDFVGEWTNTNLDLTSSSSLVNGVVTTKDGNQLNLKDFRYVNGIHTQGIPGS